MALSRRRVLTVFPSTTNGIVLVVALPAVVDSGAIVVVGAGSVAVVVETTASSGDVADSQTRALLGDTSRPKPDQIGRWAAHAVARFLQVYGAAARPAGKSN